MQRSEYGGPHAVRHMHTCAAFTLFPWANDKSSPSSLQHQSGRSMLHFPALPEPTTGWKTKQNYTISLRRGGEGKLKEDRTMGITSHTSPFSTNKEGCNNGHYFPHILSNTQKEDRTMGIASHKSSLTQTKEDRTMGITSHASPLTQTEEDSTMGITSHASSMKQQEGG